MAADYARLVKAAAAKTWNFPRADIVDVHDADTVEVDVIQEIDAGFQHIITSRQRHALRLFGMNANELADPGGIEARDYLKTLIPGGTQLRLSSVKDDKFGGRWLAILWAKDPAGNEYNVVQHLIDTHWAMPWNGQGVKPKPPWPRPEMAG